MLTDAPLPPSLPHHLNSTTHDHDDASTAASSANTPVLVPIPHDREASTDGPSPEVPPTLADESIDHVNAHLKGEDSDMHDHSAAGINAPGKAPAASTLGSKTTIDVNARAASASGDDMEIDGESNIDSDDNDLPGFDPATLTDLPRLPSSSQVNGGVHPQQPQFTPKTHSPSPSHSRSRSPNGIALHGSMSSDANTMPVDASIPRTPALQDSQPDDASMADGERPAKRPRNAYEESSTSVRLLSRIGCVYFFVAELTYNIIVTSLSANSSNLCHLRLPTPLCNPLLHDLARPSPCLPPLSPLDSSSMH